MKLRKPIVLMVFIPMLAFATQAVAKDWLNYGGAGAQNPPGNIRGYSPNSPQSGAGEPRNFGHLGGSGNKESRSLIETDSLSRINAEGRNK